MSERATAQALPAFDRSSRPLTPTLSPAYGGEGEIQLPRLRERGNTTPSPSRGRGAIRLPLPLAGEGWGEGRPDLNFAGPTTPFRSRAASEHEISA